jgi:hexosaminidase
MKKPISFLLFVSICFIVMGQQQGEIALIPQPVSFEKKGGNFEFNSYSVIEVPDKTPEVQMVARYFSQQVLRTTGYTLRVQLVGDARDSRGGIIAISLNRKADPQIGNEGYTIEINSSLVILPDFFMVFKHCYNFFLKRLKAQNW